MKKIIVILLLTFVGFSVNAQEKEQNKKAKVIFKVFGNCDMCKKRIEKAAFSVKGVKSAEWHEDCQDIHLIIDENKCTKQDVAKAIAKVGHDTEFAKTDEVTYENLHGCCHYERME